MSDVRDPRNPRDAHEPGDGRDWRDPQDEPDRGADQGSWPQRDLDKAPSSEQVSRPTAEAVSPGALAASGLEAGEVTTDWDPKVYGDRRRPTTAEQAVPWLIGLILALSGIVIVLMVLIFTDANGGFGPAPTASPSAVAVASAVPTPTVAATPSVSSSAAASPTATPGPTYGAMEMLYVSRPSAFALSQLYRRDFAKSVNPTVIAKSIDDVAHYAVAPDGTVETALVGGKLMAVVSGKPLRTIAEGVATATFGDDATTVYAVKITRSGVNDNATLFTIAFATGKATQLSMVTYKHPVVAEKSGVRAASAFDDGGEYRIYATTDGNLVLWVNGAGQWRIDPVSGDDVAVSRAPELWSPDGTRRIAITQSGEQSTLSVVGQTGAPTSSVFVSGVVSHMRWSVSGSQVVFTVARPTSNGGVHQDIYLWDLVDKKTPRQLSINGATYGAEFLGARETWRP
jgi:hypothetical protein